MLLIRFRLGLIVCLASLFSVYSAAEELEYCDVSVPDGIVLEPSERRLISVYRQPVAIPDRTGIRKARIIAQERAKGEIVRFFSQNQRSIRTVTGSDTTDASATRLVDSSGESLKKQFTRSQSETLIEMETSVASGNLRGIIQLEEDFDAEAGELCVAIGYSAKTASASHEAARWMAGDSGADEVGGGGRSHDAEGDADEDATDSYSRKKRIDW